MTQTLLKGHLLVFKKIIDFFIRLFSKDKYMKFEEIKSGAILKQTVGGLYETKYWIIYNKESDRFHSIFLQTRKQLDRNVFHVVVRDFQFNNPDYDWGFITEVHFSEIRKYKNLIFEGIFSEI